MDSYNTCEIAGYVDSVQAHGVQWVLMYSFYEASLKGSVKMISRLHRQGCHKRVYLSLAFTVKLFIYLVPMRNTANIQRRVIFQKKENVTKFNSFAELLKIFLKFQYILRAAPLFHISTKSPNCCQYAHKQKVPGLRPGHIQQCFFQTS